MKTVEDRVVAHLNEWAKLNEEDRIDENLVRGLTALARKLLPSVLRNEVAFLADIVGSVIDAPTDNPYFYLTVMIFSHYVEKCELPELPEPGESSDPDDELLAHMWMQGASALADAYKGKSVLYPRGVSAFALDGFLRDIAVETAKDREAATKDAEEAINAWVMQAHAYMNFAVALDGLRTAAEEMSEKDHAANRRKLKQKLAEVDKVRLTYVIPPKKMPKTEAQKNFKPPPFDSPELIVRDMNDAPKRMSSLRPADWTFIYRIKTLLANAPKPRVIVKNREQRGRWVPIELKTRTGKQQFVCTYCGRVSIYPDKECPIPDYVREEQERTDGKALMYWGDWLPCHEQEEEGRREAHGVRDSAG